MEIAEDLEIGEVAVVLAAVVAIGYGLKKLANQVQQVPGAIADLGRAAINSIEDGVTAGAKAVSDNAIGAVNAVSTMASTMGTIASTSGGLAIKPSIVFENNTPVDMSGTTVGDLRRAGFSDAAIADLIAQSQML